MDYDDCYADNRQHVTEVVERWSHTVAKLTTRANPFFEMKEQLILIGNLLGV